MPEISEERKEGICLALGWMYAEACATADKGLDIRKQDCGQYVDRAIKDLSKD